MAINATNTNSGSSAPILEAGSYAARCYSMIHLGTLTETIEGKTKELNKVRIGWELPTELYVFKEENGEQPRVISEEYTLSMHEKSKLRPLLESWRGKAFTNEEAECFDVSKLIGAPCMLSIVHRTSKKGNTFAKVASVSRLPKGMECDPPINEVVLLDYDNFDMNLVNSLPDFIQEKIFSSKEFNELQGEAENQRRAIEDRPELLDGNGEVITDDLPW